MTSFPAFAWLFAQPVSERFVTFSEEKHENANTKNKTSYYLKLFKEFPASEEEMLEIVLATREHKIYIFSPPRNILYIYLYNNASFTSVSNGK